MIVEIEYVTDPAQATQDVVALTVIGHKERLLADDVVAQLPEAARAIWPTMVESLSPGDSGAVTHTWVAAEPAFEATAERVVGRAARQCR